MSVIIETSIGDITVDLFTDERPKCCLNFLKLCKMKYYNFSLFHSVQENLVAQVGDPTATGRGGESIFGQLYGEQARFFDMEVSPRIKHSKKGLVSMVNNGSGMHGSQFFFTLADSLDYLDGKHTVFAEVAEGMEIIDKLNKTFCDESFRPHQDIRIYHTVILDDPYDDPDGMEVPDQSPGPTQEMIDSDRIPCDADVMADEGKTEEEIAEMMAEKEAKANTQLLEMVGDLPDAEIAPPENVLFVCKLNPVTTSDDLEIIFSRFGTIVSCEVIKDSKSGESLQYAFIEFSSEKECESAYFKMDNVLIDDRRIHVDFSQSVSKLKWKGKGRGVEIITGSTAPPFILKNQQRQDSRYDLVYEHDEEERELSKKMKSKRSSTKDEEDSSSPHRKRKKKSLSPEGNRRLIEKKNYQDDRRFGKNDKDRSEREDRTGYVRNRKDEERERRDYDRKQRNSQRSDNRNELRGREDDGRQKQRNYSSHRDSREYSHNRADHRASNKRPDRSKDFYSSRRDERKDYRSRSRSPFHRSKSPVGKRDRKTERYESESADRKAREDKRERKVIESSSEYESQNYSKSKRSKDKYGKRQKEYQNSVSSENESSEEEKKKKKKKKKKQKEVSSDESEVYVRNARGRDNSDSYSSDEMDRKRNKQNKKKKKKRKDYVSSDESEDEIDRRKFTRDSSVSSNDSVKIKKKKKKEKSRR